MNFSQLDFGLFGIKMYGVFLGIAFFIASWYWYKLIQREKLPHDFFVHHFWRWLVGGILLGRLGALLATPEVFDTYGLFSFFAFWQGELHFISFIIGFLLVMYTDLQQHEAKPLRWLDLGIFPFLLAVMIADLAGFFTGAVYGSETNLFWGVKYEATGVKILAPVHPVTIYAFLSHLGLWFAAKHYWPLWKKSPGKIATATAIAFVALDFVWQFFRADETLMLFNFVRLEQFIEVWLLLGLLFWYRKHFR